MQRAEVIGFAETRDPLVEGRLMDAIRIGGYSKNDIAVKWGGSSCVALLPDEGNEGVAVKVPRDASTLLRSWESWQHEYNSLRLIGENRSSSPPLILPRLISQNDALPYRVTTLVSGLQYDGYDEVRAFSDEEKQSFGRRAAEWVVWLSQELSIDDYQKHSSFRPPHRSQAILQHCHPHSLPQQVLSYLNQDAVGEAGTIVYMQYHYFREQGKFEPTMVGHGDLSPLNMTFKPSTDGTRHVSGLFDLDHMQPSTAEYELSRIARLGRSCIDAADDKYKSLTGLDLDRRVVLFWARAHVTSIAIAQVLRGFPNWSPAQLRSELALVWRGRIDDWHELDKAQELMNNSRMLFTPDEVS